MAYLVLARKYRPETFDDVRGQDHITELLKKAVSSKHIAHSYLFCGPRGIGKTSCARILAKSLNCKKGITTKPCGECPACREIAQGNSFDVLEIDGASNRGIDEVRALRENVKFSPSYGKYKIYIVDEVHMLTTEAFNALLKTLEEPPEHAVFILATTDPNKIPSTIISRCQRFDFKRIPVPALAESLKDISKKEKLKIEQEAVYSIAKSAKGSFRDALGILDQVSALKSREIVGEDINTMLGLVETDLLFKLVDSLADNNCPQALNTLDEIIDKGKDIKQLSKDLIEHFRNLMVVKVGGKSLGRLLEYPVTFKEMFLAQSRRFTLKKILNAIDILIESQEISRITESLRTPLEIVFAKLTYRGEQALTEETQKDEGPREEEAVQVKPHPSAQDHTQKPQQQEISKFTSGAHDTGKSDVNIQKVRKLWDKLTHAVSREKMSLATYMQEGYPVEYEHPFLTIGFKKDYEFHKEALEEKQYIDMVERIFSEHLDERVRVRYEIVEGLEEGHLKQEPLVQSVLDKFKGQVVNKWHTEFKGDAVS